MPEGQQNDRAGRAADAAKPCSLADMVESASKNPNLLTAAKAPAKDEEIEVSERIIHTSDEEFEAQVLKADGPVLVDFWAEWCGPCKMIAPVLDQVAEEYGDKITVAKMDVDTNKQTAMKFNVRSIPTLMIFKDGELHDTKLGAMSKGQLTEFIDGAIA